MTSKTFRNFWRAAFRADTWASSRLVDRARTSDSDEGRFGFQFDQVVVAEPVRIGCYRQQQLLVGDGTSRWDLESLGPGRMAVEFEPNFVAAWCQLKVERGLAPRLSIDDDSCRRGSRTERQRSRRGGGRRLGGRQGKRCKGNDNSGAGHGPIGHGSGGAIQPSLPWRPSTVTDVTKFNSVQQGHASLLGEIWYHHAMLRRLLVANRGEIALRVMRTAADLGITTVAVFSEDDRSQPHVGAADTALPLTGEGPAAYLDGARIVDFARQAQCDAVHPGYGLLSGTARFCTAVRQAGGGEICRPELGHARPVGEQTPGARAGGRVWRADSRAVGGPAGRGGGFGVYARPRSTHHAQGHQRRRGARFAGRRSSRRSRFGVPGVRFGGPPKPSARGELYAERLLPTARHIEVQIAADGRRAVHLGERDCTLQRRRQKIIEVAPAPRLAANVRAHVLEAARPLASSTPYVGLGTFEFLVTPSDEWFFIECNPRLQVEHTVTEEITGLDLVALQLRLADGASLSDLGLSESPAPRGFAMQLRIYAESTDTEGRVQPAEGTVRAFEPTLGPGVRVDAAVAVGQPVNPRFDPLLAKLIVRVPEPNLETGLRRAKRALEGLRGDRSADERAHLGGAHRAF